MEKCSRLCLKISVRHNFATVKGLDMSDQAPIIVVGTGQCGMTAIETLRRAGYDNRLCFIGCEPYIPYQRPPLSKSFLKGEMSQERLLITGDAYFAKYEVDTMFGRKVVSIDTDRQTTNLDDGRQISYSKLLLATGSVARAIDIPKANLDGIYSLRTLDDGKCLTAALSSCTAKVAIIGGGYVGLEVAASIRTQGHSVTIIESADRILKRVVCPQVSYFFECLHRSHGVTLLKGIMPVRFLGEKKVSGIELANGDVIPCDLVVVGIGNLPKTCLARNSHIETYNGISVNEACRTSAPHVYAAGDCASFPSRRYGRTIRLESVQNAIDQGKAAAHAMLGKAVLYDPVPWFWSDQYNVKLQIAGLSYGYDHAELKLGSHQESFSVTYFKNGEVICVDAANQPRTHVKARRAFESNSKL